MEGEIGMDDQQVIDLVNFNHRLRELTDNLQAISARRKKVNSLVQNLSKLWRKS